MDHPSVSDAGRNAPYATLASLLGVKGPFRLVPQGSTPKPHIVLKRDCSKGQDDFEETSSTVARFSFIAGKKFTISKGQPLLFSVASPSDRDGKTLLCDDSTFCLEADIANGFEENENDEEGESPRIEGVNKRILENIDGLPPKMRKSYSRMASYASYIQKEHPSSLGFPGYPLSAHTPRVFSTAAVQTDIPLPVPFTPVEPPATPRMSLSTAGHPDTYPIHLPSPVSADHAREPISEGPLELEGEEMADDLSRAERSLSPMDFSSASSSAASTPALKVFDLIEESEEAIPMECDTPLVGRAVSPPLDAPLLLLPPPASQLPLPTSSLSPFALSPPPATSSPATPPPAIPVPEIPAPAIPPLATPPPATPPPTILPPAIPPPAIPPPAIPPPAIPPSVIPPSATPPPSIPPPAIPPHAIPPPATATPPPATPSPATPSPAIPPPAIPPPEIPPPEIPPPAIHPFPLAIPTSAPSITLPVSFIPPPALVSPTLAVPSGEPAPVVDPSAPLTLEMRVGPTPPQSLSPRPHNRISALKTNTPVEVPKEGAPKPVETQVLSVKKEMILGFDRLWTVPNAFASSSKPGSVTHRNSIDRIPTQPRAMMEPPRNTFHLSARAQEKAPVTSCFPTPISMKTSNSSTPVRGSSPPDPKALVYISSGSSSNPLGIRPSSGNAFAPCAAPKPVPKAPRSLITSTVAATAQLKKPVVVGAKWSAVRSGSGPASALGPTSTSNASLSSGGVSASVTSSLTSISSSNSFSAVTPASSPVVPAANPAGLSLILRYDSPSPPPPTESDPPPPLPPQQSQPQGQSPVAKWKRISSLVETNPDVPAKKMEATTMNGCTEVMKVPPSASTLNTFTSTKRPPDDSSTKVTQDKLKLQTVLAGLASKDVEMSPTATPSPLRHHTASISSTSSSSLSTLSSTSSSSRTKTSATVAGTSISSFSSSAKPQPAPPPLVLPTIKIAQKPAPLTHPLPPKPPQPQMVGSSYRPTATTKRERSLDREPAESSSVKRPQLRSDWPATLPSAEYKLQPIGHGHGVDLCVQKISFSEDGGLIALICADRTLRIWENKQPAAEVARLSHNAPISSVCWAHDVVAVVSLTVDGVVSTWTRVGKEWKYAKLFVVSDIVCMDNACLVYARDRIAVTTSSGVKVFLLLHGIWQPQRDIVRSGITAIRFVQDGNALVGGCRDGVLWYCEVPNGTLRVHTFLSTRAITSIDVHPTGMYLLIAQDGGKAQLVTLKPNENKGTVERVYTSDKLEALHSKSFAAVFATKGQAVLWGTVNGCGLVWDRKKGTIVYGLKHPDGDAIQAAATFDGRPGVDGLMITGTKFGRLFWWPQPVAAAPSNNNNNNNSDESQRKRQKLS